MDEELRTVWCGNLANEVTEEILYELFLQAGPLDNIRLPKDKNGKQRSFGFIVYKHQCSVPYSIALFEGTYLFNRLLNLKMHTNRVSQSNNMKPSSFPVSQDTSALENKFLMNSRFAFTTLQNANLISQDIFMGINQLTTASLRGQWNGNHNPNLDKHSSHYSNDRNKYNDHCKYNSVKKHHSDRNQRYEQKDCRETLKGEHQKHYHNRKRKR